MTWNEPPEIPECKILLLSGLWKEFDRPDRNRKHYRERHPVKIDEVIYCNICGAGWHVNAYGDRGARERAAACYQSHIDNGDMDETAGRAFFLSGGSFGYVNVKKGGLQDGKKEKEPGKRE